MRTVSRKKPAWRTAGLGLHQRPCDRFHGDFTETLEAVRAFVPHWKVK